MVSLETLRAQRAVEVAAKPYVFPRFKKPGKAKGFVPVLATGAVGDLVISLAVVEAISRAAGHVRFWCAYPELAAWIARTTWDGGPITVEPDPFPGFDHQIVLNTLARFELGKDFRGFNNPAVEAMHERWQKVRAASTVLTAALACHPYLDYLAPTTGYTRSELPFRMLGLPPALKIIRPQAGPYDYEPFITVHDGVDATQRGIARPTKTWHLKHWAKFVAAFKERHPDTAVVQIGGPVSRPIPGVDHQLTGRTTPPEAFKILSRSKLHVDGESGLVHAARAMGVMSVVMYGPTPASFFGYAGNAEVHGTFGCEGCWWLKDDWLERCPRGFDGPKCMDSISVEAVLEAVGKGLKC